MEYTSKEVYEYVSRKMNDPIMERKKCSVSWQDFPIYKSDLQFYSKVSPIFDVPEDYAKQFFEKNNDVKDCFEYKNGVLKAKLPTPTLCPEERRRRRFSICNEKSLYKRKCDYSGENMISIFSPNKQNKVYKNSYRWNDSWDPLKYWEDKDQEFWISIKKLLDNVPIFCNFCVNWVNSDYTNHAVQPKDSYMCFGVIEPVNSLYIRQANKAENCVDCYYIIQSSNCYNCINIVKSFNMISCTDCTNCSFCINCAWCIWCHDCFDCCDLDNKSYCINNIQYTKEEYKKNVANAKIANRNRNILWCKLKMSENSFWNNLVNAQNSAFIYDIESCSNTKYTDSEVELEDTYDSYWAKSKLSLEIISCSDLYHCGFIFYWNNNSECRYCWSCYNSKNLFWCIWLKNKEYCIYNKQYTKEEYNKIVPEIIAQMIRDKERWEFFDPKLSYFGYNESTAMEYCPLTKEEALKKWYKREDFEPPLPQVEKNVQWKDLPKQWCKIIQDKKPEILQKILNYAVICEISKKPFRITKQEIDFYVKYNIPLPTKHPDIRHQERLARKDPTTMHLIHCDQCWEEMLSVHKKWPWKTILCEKCYYSQK